MFNSQEAIAQTADYVKTTLKADAAHDWYHIERVWKLARRLAVEEGADPFVVELAALLHDIADWKFHGGDETAGSRVAGEWLEKLGVAREVREHVCEIIAHLSFKGAGVNDDMATLEGQVVQDADRLDALGAIGIARTFAYGGHKGQPLYNPGVKPVLHETFAAYKSNQGNSLNHFHEKLLLLKDRLKTRSARKIAEQRHAYMEEFVARFLAEWNGDV